MQRLSVQEKKFSWRRAEKMEAVKRRKMESSKESETQLEALPEEMLATIFSYITDTRDIFRLLTVNRQIESATKKACCQKVRSLQIVNAGTAPYKLNGYAIAKEQHLCHMSQKLYEEGKRSLNTLKLAGVGLSSVLTVMQDPTPHILTELRLELDSRYLSVRQPNINGVHHIITASAGSLKKVVLCLKGALQHNTQLNTSLAGCTQLKELALQQCHVSQQDVQGICTGKSLHSIVIEQFRQAVGTTPGLPFVSGDTIYEEMLVGLNRNILRLNIDLQPLSIAEFNLTVQPYPHLTRIRIATYSIRETARIHGQLDAFLRIFPALQHMLIMNNCFMEQCHQPGTIRNFFTSVLPTLTDERRKVRRLQPPPMPLILQSSSSFESSSKIQPLGV